MTLLIVFGFIVLVAIAVYTTVVAAVAVLGEHEFYGKASASLVFVAVAAVFWALVIWINPFSISIGM